jgi:hypothetical protein
MDQASRNGNDESHIEDEIRDARIGQYRDWLIPGTIFSSIAASIFVLAITAEKPGRIQLFTAITSFISIGSYITSLFYAFTRLESITILRLRAVSEPGLLYASVVSGTVFLLIGLVILSFSKSTAIGAAVVALFYNLSNRLYPNVAIREGDAAEINIAMRRCITNEGLRNFTQPILVPHGCHHVSLEHSDHHVADENTSCHDFGR